MMLLKQWQKFVTLTLPNMIAGHHSVLVSGAGSIGQRHLKNLKALGVESIAACDPNQDAIAKVNSELGIKGYLDLPQALDAFKPSIVFVCSPTSLHVAQARNAVRSGAHVFIEKPLSHAMEGVGALLEEAQGAGVTTMVACNMRFHVGPRTVKKLIEEGRIGQVLSGRIQTGSYLPSWRPHQDYKESYSADLQSGGAILDCIHEIDLALWYFGPAKLAGAAALPASSIGLQVDGLAELLMKHDSGIISSVHLNFIQRDYRRCCQIIGSEGTLYWDAEAGRVDVYGGGGGKQESLREPAGWDENQIYVDEVKHFLSAVQNAEPACCPLEDGKAALEIAIHARNA